MSEPTAATLAVKVAEHERRLGKHEKLLDILRNRLPNWAVFLIAALTAALGAFIKGAI